tara:strand:+ start:145 stop:384 length:240 start_codon:yes stop_codon:yes gene_type:complete
VEKMKEFFEKPPVHDLKVGDLVTCICHDAVAIVVQLFDVHDDIPMNMAKIWWIRRPDNHSTHVWMHTIARLKKYNIAAE